MGGLPTFAAMQQQRLPFEQTHRFSQLFLDYVAQKDALSNFYRFAPSADGLGQALEQRKFTPEKRQALVEALNEQYQHLEVNAGVAANIKALASEATFTVTTGHQLCLFTGPLYFLYKIVTTINLAGKLQEKYPGKRIVPVYWMASEDHDFEEINHANVFGKRLEWQQSEGGPVGWLSTESIEPVIAELETLLGSRDGAEQLVQQFRTCYLSAANLADATRALVHQLFGAYGLVIVDGDSRALKAEFAPYMRNELLHQIAEPAVAQASEQLAEAGYKTQVTPRGINLFWIQKGLRERIVAQGDDFEVLNHKKFTRSELLDALENQPEAFSPNVILRPVYQEVVLPNLAYVGGPGELAYWLQLKAAFDAFEVPFPVLMPRSFAMIVDGTSLGKIAKLGLKPADVFEDPEQLKKAWVQTHSNAELSLEQEKNALAALFASAREKAVAVDATLEKAVTGEEQRQLNALNSLEKRVLKAEKQRHEVALRQIDGLAAKLCPNGGLQERSENYIPFQLRFDATFVELLINNLDPFKLDFALLLEDA